VIIEKGREIKELTQGILLTNSLWSSDYGGIHEHACFIKTASSYILITGCCHPGLNAILKERSALGIPLSAHLHIIGGFHGFRFSNIEAEELYPLTNSVICCHCTMNTQIFKEQFGNKCSAGIVGKQYNFY
jgi:metal-dependent hydrolase (beta-lactamase superfamily II)